MENMRTEEAEVYIRDERTTWRGRRAHACAFSSHNYKEAGAFISHLPSFRELQSMERYCLHLSSEHAPPAGVW